MSSGVQGFRVPALSALGVYCGAVVFGRPREGPCGSDLRGGCRISEFRVLGFRGMCF